MPANGFSAPSAPLFAALAALTLLAGCVDPFAPGAEGTTAASMSFAQPAIATDPTVYAARSDDGFTVPALPVEKIPEAYRRQLVDYATGEPPGTIIIDPSQKVLYYTMGRNKALRYGIAVGKAGFQWSGEALVAEKKHWPTWTPPKEMIARKPELSKWEKGQPGGPTNPLGARAIYLASGGVDYGYRIHGTPEWQSIGRNASSGCIRMINQDVMDLYERVQGGTKVIVLTASGEMPKGLSIPKPPAVKKAAPAPAATPATLSGPPAGPPAPMRGLRPMTVAAAPDATASDGAAASAASAAPAASATDETAAAGAATPAAVPAIAEIMATACADRQPDGSCAVN